MLLIIGLDGADWRILNPWIAQGHLPHLAALQARGAWGPLRSPLRPESSIAWSTFATGRLPGAHGIFSFSRRLDHSYRYGLNNALALRAPTFWQWAGGQKRIALLNVPMTYPPQPLAEGGIVAGMLTPDLRSPFTQPAAWREQLLAAVPDYVINVDRSGLDLPAFIRQTTRAIRARGRAGQWLLAQGPWDAAVIVFTATDRLQHYSLHLLHPEHPAYDQAQAQRLLPLLLAAYQAIDEAIGHLLAAAGDDATVLLLSDHGFAPCSRLFYVNNWLENQGWLQRHSRAAAQPDLWQRLRRRPWLRQLKQRLPLVRDVRRGLAPDSTLQGIDWAHTAAFYAPDSGIRLNIRGRDPQGLLSPGQAEDLAQEISERLLALQDPASGRSPIVAVYPRAQAYPGPHSDLASDLIIEPRRDDEDITANTAIAFGFGPDVFCDSGEITGNHTFDGILLAAGPDIAPRPLRGCRLQDIAPTVLHALQAPPPPMDGRILPLWAHPRPALPPQEGPPTAGEGPANTMGRDDEAIISERLRSLGYL